MSVEMSSKSGEIEWEALNTMPAGNKTKYGRKSPVWWARVTAVGLGLLLLIAIFGFVAHNTDAISHLNSLKVGLMRSEERLSNLTKDNIALRDEQHELKLNISRLTEEMQALKGQYGAVAVSQHDLLQEFRRLNHSVTAKTCQPGWVMFNDKCYYASAREQTKTWDESRTDCLQRRADLVIINSREELDFVTKMHSSAWIGLSDRRQEGTWKWVDGSNLEGEGFWQKGEPNAAGDEDCVHISNSEGEWNDLNCGGKQPWICET
ncbi:CD209 antigen-like protein E [Mugil cephalus]|uniref:CD209 antigen-like protein E n=1 Tax=Mugil cephalus TaxID=48193 RepID=UPI001FB7B1FF|nr:CD209 antigen-like protein E [Mugil cephalus]